MEEIIRLINKEFKPKFELDSNDIDDLREVINLFLYDGIDDLRNEVEDLKEEVELLTELNAELRRDAYGF